MLPTVLFPRAAVLLVVAGLLGGCAQFKALMDPDKDREAEAETEPTETAEATPQPEDAPTPAIEDIIQLLQAGEYVEAEAALDRLMAVDPGHPAGRNLMSQLQADPQEALGSAYQIHTVAAGESLAQIAREHLGDASQFVILARYNELEQPSRLLVGQRLRIPEGSMATMDAPEAPDTGDAPAAAYREAIETELEAGHYEQALALASQAQAELAVSGSGADWLQPLQREAEAGYWEQSGHAARDAGDRSEALAAYNQALEHDPERRSVVEARDAVRKAHKEALHEEAIVRYRNQDLDTAIALWDQALELDPEFEAARGYRLRAQELLRRLDALDNS
ncbi:LysM peptidoglycan-binding domain-containing protein [Thioalkalivibrio sp. ALJ7]|uniref:LysM peptidoglycan-binding domain-containing protein n=1 Tax=Thioalkalivibrio sp. ALJ7 TaxID=1158756 RepID=UPI00037661DF|nr:LysM peptidoglycan-binding domain-containing protein [Thioalkalivibrio sp. ALJ7]